MLLSYTTPTAQVFLALAQHKPCRFDAGGAALGLGPPYHRGTPENKVTPIQLTLLIWNDMKDLIEMNVSVKDGDSQLKTQHPDLKFWALVSAFPWFQLFQNVMSSYSKRLVLSLLRESFMKMPKDSDKWLGRCCSRIFLTRAHKKQVSDKAKLILISLWAQ